MLRILILAVAALFVVPTLRAQQTDTGATTNPPQASMKKSTENSGVQTTSLDAVRPGHRLDPADVDILTGKRDREIEASRGEPVSLVIGSYGDPYAFNGRRGELLDFPLLPLTRITNPYFFFSIAPRGFGRGVFRGHR